MVSSRAPSVSVSRAGAATSVVVSENSGSLAAAAAATGNGVNGDDSVNSVGRHLRGDAGRNVVGVDVGGERWSQSGPPSLSMAVDVHNLVSATLDEPDAYSLSPEREAGSRTAEDKLLGSQEESYEGFGYALVGGEGEEDVESPGDSSSAPSPTEPNSLRNARSPNSTIGRHSWLRTSLRRIPPCSGKKRLSSNALASQLYRSSSFNSTGRGSNCDTADDMYSDVSLEDDVQDLNQRVQMIQKQMHALVDTQSVGEERYARAKQENATLRARIIMLEEASKDAETRAEERLQTEQRRHREWASRIERERQLQLENYAIKLQVAELDSSNLRNEVTRLREQLERAKADRTRLEDARDEAIREAETAREAERQSLSRANEVNSLLEVAREELVARAEDQQRLEELVQQIAQLRARNKSLEESRDELQAAAALQAGRELLMLNPCTNNVEKEASLAAELLAGMSQEEADGKSLAESGEPCTIFEMRQALKEQQEVNSQLRAYIDGILLNIVENYPQLLEVKQGP